MINRQTLKQFVRVLLPIIVLYVGTYFCLSACGEYQFAQSVHLRYSFGFAVSDISHWQPKYLRWQQFRTISGDETTRGNPGGDLFCPLIMLDRWAIHPTRQLMADQE